MHKDFRNLAPVVLYIIDSFRLVFPRFGGHTEELEV